MYEFLLFFFNDTATTEIYTLSLHDALPIYLGQPPAQRLEQVQSLLQLAPPRVVGPVVGGVRARVDRQARDVAELRGRRSEEHTSELQSRQYLVCRLLLEKKKQERIKYHSV